jgi:hypothetical protein
MTMANSQNNTPTSSTIAVIATPLDNGYMYFYTLSAMRFTRLTRKQAESFRNKIPPMLHFLLLCRRRMDARGFDPNSRLYMLVDKAQSSLQSLFVELHYISCGSGVGEPPEKE